MEDTENNVFGGYINSRIDQYRWQEGDKWKGSNITDPHSFVFSLKSNGRLEEPMKFEIKSEYPEDEQNDHSLEMKRKRENIKRDQRNKQAKNNSKHLKKFNKKKLKKLFQKKK